MGPTFLVPNLGHNFGSQIWVPNDGLKLGAPKAPKLDPNIDRYFGPQIWGPGSKFARAFAQGVSDHQVFVVVSATVRTVRQHSFRVLFVCLFVCFFSNNAAPRRGRPPVLVKFEIAFKNDELEHVQQKITSTTGGNTQDAKVISATSE